MKKFLMSSFQYRNKTGFTLIELLIVISIIGILTTMIMVSFRSAQQRARDAQRKSDLRSLKTALALYYSDYQRFPASSAGGEIVGCNTGSGNPVACPWESSWSQDGKTFMNSLPVDPVNTAQYIYSYNYINEDSYTLESVLENVNDADIDTSQSRCSAGSPYLPGTYVVCQD